MSTLSSVAADASRGHLLDAAVRVIERGDEPTMRSVAAEAGVAERTIYRYFPAREALLEALAPRLRERAGAPLPSNARDLEAYAEQLMRTFAANAGLTRALLTTAWVRAYFLRSRRQNLTGMAALIDAAYPRAATDTRAAATASLRAALSGSTWLYLSDAGVDTESIVTQARWLVRTVLAELARGPRRRTAPSR